MAARLRLLLGSTRPRRPSTADSARSSADSRRPSRTCEDQATRPALTSISSMCDKFAACEPISQALPCKASCDKLASCEPINLKIAYHKYASSWHQKHHICIDQVHSAPLPLESLASRAPRPRTLSSRSGMSLSWSCAGPTRKTDMGSPRLAPSRALSLGSAAHSASSAASSRLQARMEETS